MKQFYFVVISISLFSIMSCSKNHGVVSDSVVIISAHDVEGRWKIIQYGDSGIDNTDAFASVNIQFNSTGGLSVNKNDTVFGGSWIIQPDIGLDKLNISVSTEQLPYDILEKDWYIEKKSTTTLSLFYPRGNTPETLELQRY
jgi:hypothetical protein